MESKAISTELRENMEEIKLKEGYELLFSAKANGHVRTTILDSYRCLQIKAAFVNKGKGEKEYKVTIGSEEFVLKTMDIDPSELSRLYKIRKGYKTMKKLGRKFPFIIELVDMKETNFEECKRLEILMKYGGETLRELMLDATKEEIKRWLVMSVDVLSFLEAKCVCFLNFNPNSIVYKDGFLKIVDFEDCQEFDKLFDCRNNLISSKDLHISDDSDRLCLCKQDVYFWAMTFYQIITKNIFSMSEVSSKEFSDMISNCKKVFKLGENNNVEDIISECLTNLPEKRPDFATISNALQEIRQEISYNDLKLGQAYAEIGNAFLKANLSLEVYYDIVLEIYKAKYGEKHAETATAYCNCGISSVSKYLYGDNEEYLEKALKIRLKLFGENHKDTADSFFFLALKYHRNPNKSRAEALEYHEKALAIRLNLFGENHADTADSYEKLSDFYSSDCQKGKEYYEKAMNISFKLFENNQIDEEYLYEKSNLLYGDFSSINRAIFNHNHQSLDENCLDSATNYADFADNFDLAKSIEFSEKALKIRIKLLGEVHKDTACSYDQVAKYSNIQKVLEYHEKALNIRLKLLGEDHPETINSYDAIALVYARSGENKKALECYEKIVKGNIKLFGESYYKVRNSYREMSKIYEKLGNDRKEIEYHEKSFGLHQSIILAGENQLDTAKAYFECAKSFQKDLIRAQEYIEKSLQIYLNLLGENHDDTAKFYFDIAEFYKKGSDVKKTLDYYERSLQIRLKLHGEDHKDTAHSFQAIGSFYFQLNDKKKALEYYEKALSIYCISTEDKEESEFIFYGEIARLYCNLNDYKKAAEYFEKAANYNRYGIYGVFKKPHFYRAFAILNKKLGNYQIALDNYFKYLDFQIFPDEERKDTAFAYVEIALCYRELKKFSKGLEYCKKAFDIYLEVLGDSMETCNACKETAIFYEDLNDLTKSLEYYIKALQIAHKLFEEDDVNISGLYHAIAIILENLNQTERALYYYEKSLHCYRRNPLSEQVKEIVNTIKEKIIELKNNYFTFD